MTDAMTSVSTEDRSFPKYTSGKEIEASVTAEQAVAHLLSIVAQYNALLAKEEFSEASAFAVGMELFSRISYREMSPVVRAVSLDTVERVLATLDESMAEVNEAERLSKFSAD